MDEQSPRVALITGARRAMGKAAAMELARRGWSIFFEHAGPDEDAEDTAEALQAAAQEGGCRIEVSFAKADLTDGASREQLIEQVLEAFGRIDMLVSAAGSPPAAPADLLEVTEEAFRATIETSLTGTLFLTQLVASEMVRLAEAGQIENPKIVTINSISAYTTSTDHGPQCISRAALAMMTRLFADRLGEHGINVYEIRTGILTAGPGDAAHEKYESLIADGLTPIRRWGRPQDVARAVAAVAEDLLDFSTGEVINVDGGFHLRRL